MDFNPYRQWLSLDDRPSNFYVLLGLPPLENDTDRIRSAASEVISRVRHVQPGDHVGAWKQLLDQIEEARDSLCDPTKKQEYDQRLRNQVDTVAVSLTRSNLNQKLRSTLSPTMAQQVPDPMSPLDDADSSRRSRKAEPPAEPNPRIRQSHVSARRRGRYSQSRRVVPRRTRRYPRWSRPLTLAVGTLAFLLVAAALWFALKSNQQLLSSASTDPPNPPSRSNELIPKQSSTARPEVLTPIENSGESMPRRRRFAGRTAGMKRVDAPEDATHTPAADTPAADTPAAMSGNAAESQPTAAELRRITRLLRDASRHLSEREPTQAKECLLQARHLAKTSELEARVARLDSLRQYVQGFWQSVEDGMVDLENTELVMNDQRMFVVQLTPEQIILRIEGQNRRFSRNSLPANLVMAIADRWFDQNASSTKVFKGAFMAVTPGFSQQEVRQLWQRAQQEGADLGDLMLVLNDLEAMP